MPGGEPEEISDTDVHEKLPWEVEKDDLNERLTKVDNFEKFCVILEAKGYDKASDLAKRLQIYAKEAIERLKSNLGARSGTKKVKEKVGEMVESDHDLFELTVGDKILDETIKKKMVELLKLEIEKA